MAVLHRDEEVKQLRKKMELEIQNSCSRGRCDHVG